MELSMIGSVIIGLTIFELLYWLFSVIVETNKETLDPEAQDYLIRRNNKNQNVVATNKEKEKD